MASTSESTASLPSVQTVWKIVRKGDPAKALVKEEAPVPKIIPKGYVLIKIQAASLNPMCVNHNFTTYFCPGLIPTLLTVDTK